MDKGQLVYEYNMMIIDATSPARTKFPPETQDRSGYADRETRGAADVVLAVDGAEVARAHGQAHRSGAFTASESFDVGLDLGSPVSLDYFDRAPSRSTAKSPS